MSLGARDAAVVWHPFTPLIGGDAPLPVVAGDGAYIVTEDGRRLLDGISSWWVNLHGHSHPHIVEAVHRQLLKLDHVIFAGFTHEPAVRLAERLLSHFSPEGGKVFYSDNGSTAVEVAIKMAVQYWYNRGEPRRTLVTLEGAYHGDTVGAMSVSARGPFTEPFNELLFEVARIPFPERGSEERSFSALEAVLKTGTCAAFLFEPLILGAGGMLMYSSEVLECYLSLCRQYDVLVVADEVMTGFGRTGRVFATQSVSQGPDIMALSKGITGGTMALGATLCRDSIWNVFRSTERKHTFFHGHSYTANPLACAAALASLDLLESRECQQAITALASRQQEAAERFSVFREFRNVRCSGTILALDVVLQSDDVGYFSSLRTRIYNHFLDRGILLRPLGNTVYVMPPYCISSDELEKIYEAIEELTHSAGVNEFSSNCGGSV